MFFKSRSQPVADTAVAQQATNEPTRKLSIGTTASAGVGAVIAGALASYGNEAIREVLIEVVPSIATKAATANFIIFLVVTVAAYVANKSAGLGAGYNVLDKPNIPLERAAPVATRSQGERRPSPSNFKGDK